MPSISPWSSTGAITVAPSGSHSPAVAATENLVHLIWSHARMLYHSCGTLGQWSAPSRIAAGEHPALAVAPDGTLHCVFANQFFGNYEIYHVTWNGSKWTLPQNVSRTSGYSTHPALAITHDDALHVAWTDMTPGEAVIYHATREPDGWVNEAIPNCSGSMPTVTSLPNGDVYVAWQDRLIGTRFYEVFSAIRRGDAWTLPEIVSDSPHNHALFPQLAASRQGHCYILWQEERLGVYHIRFAGRGAGAWSEPEQISDPGADCRLPRIAAGPDGFPQVLWLAGRVLHHRARRGDHAVPWSAPEPVPIECASPIDAALSIATTGHLHIVACSYDTSYACQLFHIQRQALAKPTLFMPIIARDV